MDDYINKLLSESGVPESLDPEVRAQLIEDLTTRVAELINHRLIEAMSPEAVIEFDKLLAERPDDVQATQAFVEQHVPNKDQIVTGSLLEFRALYLGDKA